MGVSAAGLRELALFAGVGGGQLGSKLIGGIRTICYVEKEAYCQEVIKARIRDGIFDDAPIWDDIRDFDGTRWTGCVDLVSAGFPCQPFSAAGKQEGELDDRNLWPDTIRVIREVGPEWCLLENVPRLLGFAYFGTILRDLAEAGFDARWCTISAADVGAPHKRERLWIMAHTNGAGLQRQPRPGLPRARRWVGKFALGSQRVRRFFLADPDSAGLEGHGGFDCFGECPCERSAWACCRSHEDTRLARSGICRISHGVASRAHRLKALGNGQVPRVVADAWETLRG